MRLTARAPRIAAGEGLPGARHLAFARGLRGRYGHAELRAWLLEMVFPGQRRGRIAWQQPVHSTTRLHLCPRIGVTLSISNPMKLSTQQFVSSFHSAAIRSERFFHAERSSRSDSLEYRRETRMVGEASRSYPDQSVVSEAMPALVFPAHQRVQQLHDLVRHWALMPARTANASELRARLRERSGRRESAPPDAPKLVAARPRTVVESSHSPERSSTQSVAARAAVPPAQPADAVKRASPQPGQPITAASMPLNIDSLTSQVIQQLDRRLVAYRERMGRV